MWQSGGIASRGKPIVKPDDAKGLKIRGGSREMDMMFKGAGAATSNMPSNEIYISMQTGAIDAAATSSTSLISFKLEELSKGLTSAGGRSFFFVFEPMLMSKSIFELAAAGPAEAAHGGRRGRSSRSASRARRPTTNGCGCLRQGRRDRERDGSGRARPMARRGARERMEGFRRALREYGAVPEDGGGGLTRFPERTDMRRSNLLSGIRPAFSTRSTACWFRPARWRRSPPGWC